MKRHLYEPQKYPGKTHIHLVGCGGTGSQMLTALARIDLALRNLGGDGLEVDIFDFDKVSKSNAGRQSFYSCDIGKNKSQVLANRHRLCFPEFTVRAYPDIYRPYANCHILITCVDSRKSRRGIFQKRVTCYHIDCGNGPDHGQVILGNGKDLPWPETVLEELISDTPEDDSPSCSMADALEKQDLFVNDFAVRCASQILWNLLRHGGTDIRGAFYMLNPLTINPLKIGEM